MSIHSFYQETNFSPLSMIPRDSLQSLLLTQRNGLSCFEKNAITKKKNVSTMCTRFYKLDSTIALQDTVSCAWQSFLVTLSRNNRSKFLTALLQLDGLSSHSAMLSALATLVPSAFGPLKYVHYGLLVLELGSFMYNLHSSYELCRGLLILPWLFF